MAGMVVASFTQSPTANTDGSPTTDIWADCVPLVDPSKGWVYWNDFRTIFGDLGAAATERQDFVGFGDAGVTMLQLATERTGVLEVAGNDADNDASIIQLGGTASVQMVISDAAGEARKFWFEARIKKASIADNALAFAVGFAEENKAAANDDVLVDDTGEIKTIDFLGFRTKHDNGEELDFVYGKAATPTEVIANIKAMVANTWIKIGFKYDPAAPTGRRIKIYHDGVVQGTFVTGTDIADSAFPDAEEMAFIWATKNGDVGNVEHKTQIDWVRFAQEY